MISPDFWEKKVEAFVKQQAILASRSFPEKRQMDVSEMSKFAVDFYRHFNNVPESEVPVVYAIILAKLFGYFVHAGNLAASSRGKKNLGELLIDQDIQFGIGGQK